jgi:hypothetical protein
LYVEAGERNKAERKERERREEGEGKEGSGRCHLVCEFLFPKEYKLCHAAGQGLTT